MSMFLEPQHISVPWLQQISLTLMDEAPGGMLDYT